jgi:hypothetical protein
MPNIAELKNFGVWVETCGDTYLIGNKVVGRQSLNHLMHFFKHIIGNAKGVVGAELADVLQSGNGATAYRER